MRTESHGQPFGDLFHIVMQATGNDEFFYQWFKTRNAMHGVLGFYRAKDENMPFRRLEFWDAWISELSETMTFAGCSPMLLHCVISPATVRYNKNVVFQKKRFITDINAKPVKLGEKEERTLVKEVAGETEAFP
ncbi:MAG: hypothetical protein LBP85_06815 [Prevotellaceae bacterium]|nr:hypothetical protein [Prevotellaceae bacterium]